MVIRKYSRWKSQKKKKKYKRINYQIKVPKVRLIGPNKEAYGIIATKEAYKKAKEFGLDLVEVAPKAKPPVCKIIDYKKLLYEEEKKAKAAKKKQQTTQLKEVKFRPRIEQHDYNFKLNHIKKFIAKGHKVKITIQFRGREMVHTELGYELMNKLGKDLGELGFFEKEPEMEGHYLIGYISGTKKQK